MPVVEIVIGTLAARSVGTSTHAPSVGLEILIVIAVVVVPDVSPVESQPKPASRARSAKHAGREAISGFYDACPRGRNRRALGFRWGALAAGAGRG